MELIKQMELYAKEHHVPIMENDSMDYLCNYIKEHEIKRILEIGTAIAYSAIRMAQVRDDIEIVSIERDEERYQIACENVEKARYQNRITLIHDDALQSQVEGTFDLLFIDAAKAQYIKFFERYVSKITHSVVSDNLAFHGYVEHLETIQSRQLRQMVKKIKKYIVYLENRSDFETEFVSIGDGLAISRKKAENK
ncbi:MAG: O-methyltransferase [Erysipelotrichaceae bacterium]|nr:O-methyltransferase [Erysipelotrichaceae bacterium]